MHIRVNRNIPLPSSAISMADMKRLFQSLSRFVQEACDFEMGQIQKNPKLTDEEFEKFKQQVIQSFKLNIVINGKDGSVVVTSDPTVFDGENLPDTIASICFDSLRPVENTFKAAPQNWFKLNIDFNKPSFFDWKNPISHPTLNASLLEVSGQNSTWVSALSTNVIDFFAGRATNRKHLHRAYAYDLGLLFLGIPAGLYSGRWTFTLAKASLPNLPEILLSGAAVYGFVLGVWGYRAFFEYSKWVFPKMELTDDNKRIRGQRTIWASLAIGIVGKFLYDIGYQLLAG